MLESSFIVASGKPIIKHGVVSFGHQAKNQENSEINSQLQSSQLRILGVQEHKT